MQSNLYCTIYLVRHGQTKANVLDFYGLNSRLTKKGINQAGQIASSLQHIHFDALFSSDLIRAKQTAKIIAVQHNLTIQTKELLREKYMGVLEGRLVAEVKEELKDLYEMRDKVPYDEWKNVRLAENVETDEEVMSRFISGLREISVAYSKKTVLVVSHVQVMKTLLIHLGLASHKQMAGGKSVENTGYIKLKSDGVDFFIEEMKGVHIQQST